MCHYEDLSGEERLRMAQESVKYRVPIAPRIAVWLQEQGLHDQITNPRKVKKDEQEE